MLARVLLAVVVLAACGGGDDDAPPADAPVDTAELDAPTDAPTDAPEVDAPTDAAMVDAPTDAGSDAGTLPCDPLAAVGQQGCLAGQKCTWIRTQSTPTVVGRVGCVPDGTVAIDGACVQGAVGTTTGYDDCAAGGLCINAVCKDICAWDGSAPAACASGFNCTRYASVFSNGSDPATHGVCNRSCDPLTQLQSNGVPCGANMGCYILSNAEHSITVCAGAGSTMVGAEIVGTSYANSCIPGAQPRRKSSTSTVEECGGLCRPENVYMNNNHVHEGGVATDSCQARWGVAPPADPQGESCRYWWARESHGAVSPHGNTLGWCFRHGAHQYDSDGNGSLDRAHPRCVTLTTGDVEPPVTTPPGNDALYFWCIAATQALTRMREPRHDTLAPPW